MTQLKPSCSSTRWLVSVWCMVEQLGHGAFLTHDPIKSYELTWAWCIFNLCTLKEHLFYENVFGCVKLFFLHVYLTKPSFADIFFF